MKHDIAISAIACNFCTVQPNLMIFFAIFLLLFKFSLKLKKKVQGRGVMGNTHIFLALVARLAERKKEKYLGFKSLLSNYGSERLR